MNQIAADLFKRLLVSIGIFLALIAGWYLRPLDLGMAGPLFLYNWPLSISLIFMLVSIFWFIAERIKSWRKRQKAKHSGLSKA
jgi:hypothetical protein